MTFEQSMERLKEIVAALEKKDIPLEESLALFEEGSRLSAGCYDILKKAEQKITDISQKTEESMTE